MDAFVLKIIAIISMAFDHSGYLIFNGHFSYFNYIGRFAFPIFAFQISQGYIHTKNFKKYATRLGIFAIISQIPFMLFIHYVVGENFALNVFFTLFLGLLSIYAYDKLFEKYKSIGLLIPICLGILAQYIKTDYGFYGVAIILLFYIFRNHKYIMAFSFALATITKYTIDIYQLVIIHYQNIEVYKIYGLLCICTILPTILILIYNGKKGRDTKHLLYLFYPLHLLLLYGLYFLKI